MGPHTTYLIGSHLSNTFYQPTCPLPHILYPPITPNFAPTHKPPYSIPPAFPFTLHHLQLPILYTLCPLLLHIVYPWVRDEEQRKWGPRLRKFVDCEMPTASPPADFMGPGPHIGGLSLLHPLIGSPGPSKPVPPFLFWNHRDSRRCKFPQWSHRH